MKTFFAFVSILFLSACGKPTCSSTFVREYNQLMLDSALSVRRDDRVKTLERAKEFKSRYKNVVCDVTQRHSSKRVTVDVNQKVDEVIRNLSR